MLVATSLLNDNKNLLIKDYINVVGSYSICNSPVERIIFEGSDDTVDEFSDYAIFNCHNLTELNFATLNATDTNIPQLGATHPIEDNKYYLKNIKVVVKDEDAKTLFTNKSWDRFEIIVQNP